MQVTINGEVRTIGEGLTVHGLLESLGLAPEATVVQRNDDIVERAAYAETYVAEGDTLELVRFVAGG